MNRIKALLFFLLVFLTISTFGQDLCHSLRFVILIDGNVPVSNVYDGYFEIKKEDGLIKIPFTYEVGTIRLDNDNAEKLRTLNQDLELTIRFKFVKFEPNSAEFIYEKAIKVAWLKQTYMIFKVYNSSSKNRNILFNKNSKYGIELSTAGFSTTLPRRK